MGLLLFLFLASLLFGAGFVIAGLQIAFMLAIFFSLFLGITFFVVLLIGLSIAPALFLACLFLIALLLRRATAHRLSDDPKQLPLPLNAEAANILDTTGLVLSWIVWLSIPMLMLVLLISGKALG